MNKAISYQKSADLLERASRVLAGGVSSEFRKYNHPHALFYSSGQGSKVYDIDGNAYLDFTLSQGPLIVGHSHPDVLRAVEQYSKDGQLYAGQHIKEVELAEKLQQLIPSAELMRFCLDGSEAVQTAFRVARAKTGKTKFLRFEGHYHGWLDNVAWGISTPSIADLDDEESPNVFPWSAGLSPHSREDFVVIPWNDLSLVERTIVKHQHELAAIITEPVMCNNGCILPEEGFLKGLRSICDQYDIALIFDEVITGFRLGLAGAQGYYNVTPDLSIFAKAIASGYPISAIVGKRAWMEEVVSARVIHAGTMNTSNSTVAAALATIDILERDPDTYNRMFRLGQRLMDGLRRSARDAGQNMLVQGAGPMFNTSFTDLSVMNNYRDTLQSDKPKLARFVAGLHDQGIRIIGRGLWYISAVHTEKDIDQAIEVSRIILTDL